MSEVKIWRVYAEAYGIKKRGRKIERHTSMPAGGSECLLEITDEEFERLGSQAVNDKARTVAASWCKANMREVAKVVGSEAPAAAALLILWREDESGMMQWRPFEKSENIRFHLHPGDL